MTLDHGFELLRDEQIDEINTRARILRHKKSGAELLSLENDDENKVFAITFRTPPEDSTGVAHIMEHSVLGGSRKYRVKEPFVELVKGSLKTFLNAFTAADKTIYPVASTNLQDFYNLIDVYLDAVFFPLITQHHLDQEGWHYELDSVENPLIYKGVVFNEMKGAFSSPDSVLYRYSFHSLFPDNAYSYESGGDPEAIPDLTYEQFREFHKTFYHPSNSLIFIYGDDDPQERLRLLDIYLSEFDLQDVDAEVKLQAPFERAERLVIPYSIDAESDNGRTPKALVQMNWALPEFEDATLIMALSILSYALVSTQASPLHKALIDSGLGEALTGGGLSTSSRQLTFAVGLKGVAEENVEQLETLILETLEQLANDGIEQEMVEAALNTIEFSLRENNTGPYPRGLSLLLSALNTWTYGRDPLIPIRYEEPLTEVKEILEKDPTYLQTLIKDYLLNNLHRSTVILEPDPNLAQEKEDKEKARLAAVRAEMTEEILHEVIANTRELRRLQETPDSRDALATLPVLTLNDLDKEVKTIPIETISMEGPKVLYHDLFTNGIAYLDIGFDLRTLPQDLLPFVGLFGSLLLSMGTESEDYVKLSQRIGRKTGGIGSSTFTSAVKAQETDVAWFFLRGKATMDQTSDLLDILQDVLLTANLDNPERFKQIVLRAKAGSESSLVPAGHAVINSRLRSHFSRTNWVSEQIDGLGQLFFLRWLEEEINKDWPGVLQKLEATRRHIINRESMILNITLDSDNWQMLQSQLGELLNSLPGKRVDYQVWTPEILPINEGLTIPAQVNYVGKGANLYDLGYELHGSVNVITNFLRATWLWEKVRVQGGAYGAFSSFNKETGIFTYLSYRDPNLFSTLEAYDRTASFLRSVNIDNDELTKNIIGAIGSLDAYQLPDAKGFTSMVRYLVGMTDQERQQFRDEVLNTSILDFRAFADYLEMVSQKGHVVVMGSSDTIAKANDPNAWLEILSIL
jgi:Zn-dependent M16 (insulinase) family peptidase